MPRCIMAQSEWRRTTALITHARETLGREHPMTIRQLFYRLVSANAIANTRAQYQLVSRIMTKARDDNRCDFTWIVDRSRPDYSPSVFKDAREYTDIMKRTYRKDYWTAQENYCEIWTEKDSITGSIVDVTNELGVIVRVGRGFLSTTRCHEIADHFATIDKPIFVFYLGDHDPSGRSIETDLSERIRGYKSGHFKLQRLAVHKADIKEFALPPLRVKSTDSRATGFKRKYGHDCVELDALPPSELRERIRVAVAALIDKRKWDRAVAVEQVESSCIVQFADKMARLAVAP